MSGNTVLAPVLRSGLGGDGHGYGFGSVEGIGNGDGDDFFLEGQGIFGIEAADGVGDVDSFAAEHVVVIRDPDSCFNSLVGHAETFYAGFGLFFPDAPGDVPVDVADVIELDVEDMEVEHASNDGGDDFFLVSGWFEWRELNFVAVVVDGANRVHCGSP